LVSLQVRDVLSCEFENAGGWLEESAHHVEKRRLARAIWSDQADDGSLGDNEINRVDRHQTTEYLRDPTGFHDIFRL
jgi:hypothetical protein